MNRFVPQDLPLSGLKLIQLLEIRDARGGFTRLFEPGPLASLGWDGAIEQINLSRNRHSGTIRGLHFQRYPYAEVKLVTCVSGAIYDVAVDLRADSPTFLQWFGVELNPSNQLALLIPNGFAHGFQTLVDNSDVLYLSSAPYRPEVEDGVNVFDSTVGIRWPLEVSQISERDRTLDPIQRGFEGLHLHRT